MAEIVRIYRENLPAARFIGRIYRPEDRTGAGYDSFWGQWFANDWFTTVENAIAAAPGSWNPTSDASEAYVGLIHESDSAPYYAIGMMARPGTEAPEGFDVIDLPAADAMTCWYRGSEREVTGGFGVCRQRVEQEIGCLTGADGETWAIERYQCPRFTTPDENGLVIMDYVFLLPQG